MMKASRLVSEKLMAQTYYSHPTAEISQEASIGEDTRIWHHAQVREGAQIGRDCIIGKGVYIDAGVQIGDHVKIQNYVSVFHGVTIEDGVFIGPHVCFTNDLYPRAINFDGSPKQLDDWILVETHIKKGAAIGANSTIVCGTTVGSWAMVGAGSVISHDVPDYGLALGVPARILGFVCPCGHRLLDHRRLNEEVEADCKACGRTIKIPIWLEP